MTRLPVLFERFRYGMAKAEVVDLTNATANPLNPLILSALEPVVYLGIEWRCQFFFNNQDELQQVTLTTDRPHQREAVEKELQSSGWQQAFLETPDAAFDFLLEAKTQGVARAGELAQAFAKSAPGASESLAISFLPTHIAEMARENGYDFNHAVDSSGDGLVVIRMVATPDSLKLSFTAPLLSRKNALRFGQIIRRN